MSASQRSRWTPERRAAAAKRLSESNPSRKPETIAKIRKAWTTEMREAARKRAVANLVRRSKGPTSWTKAERVLAEALNAAGVRYLPQAKATDRYVVDFLVGTLAVEVDGSIHRLEEHRRQDALKDAGLRAAGYEVLRLTNQQVIRRPTECAMVIAGYPEVLNDIPDVPQCAWSGRKHTPEARELMRQKKIQYWASLTPEQRAAVGKESARKRLTPQTIQRLRQASKSWWESQPKEVRDSHMARARRNSPVFGRPHRHSEETRQKIRDAAKKRHRTKI